MNYNYLKSYIIRAGYSLEDYAKMLGISRVALSKKLNNQTFFSQEQMVKTKEFLKLTPEEFTNAFSIFEENVEK